MDGYSLITGDYRLTMTYGTLLFGLLFLVSGITETHDKRKVHAIIYFLFGGTIIFFSVVEIFS